MSIRVVVYNISISIYHIYIYLYYHLVYSIHISCHIYILVPIYVAACLESGIERVDHAKAKPGPFSKPPPKQDSDTQAAGLMLINQKKRFRLRGIVVTKRKSQNTEESHLIWSVLVLKFWQCLKNFKRRTC